MGWVSVSLLIFRVKEVVAFPRRDATNFAVALCCRNRLIKAPARSRLARKVG